MEKKSIAVLVDYDLYNRNVAVRKWVWSREKHTAVVLLVSNPSKLDYDPEDEIIPEYHIQDHRDFDVVIRNSGNLKDLDFKTRALSVIQDVSNLIPVVVFDSNWEVLEAYRNAGVLFTLAK